MEETANNINNTDKQNNIPQQKISLYIQSVDKLRFIFACFAMIYIFGFPTIYGSAVRILCGFSIPGKGDSSW